MSARERDVTGERRESTRMLELKEGGRLVAKWILIVRQHGHVRAAQLYDTAKLL